MHITLSLLITGVMLGFSPLYGQQDSIIQRIEKAMRTPGVDFPAELVKGKAFQVQGIQHLEEMSKTIPFENHFVRSRYSSKLFEIYNGIPPGTDASKRMVNLILSACNDQSEWLRAMNMKYLVMIARPEDFGKEQLGLLKILLLDTIHHRTPLFPIVGRLDWPEGDRIMEQFFREGPELLELDKDIPGGFIASPKWKAAIALARKGNMQAMTYLLQKAGEQTDLQVISLITQQFALVKNRPTIDFIIDFLLSDAFANPEDYDKQEYFSVALIMLAQIIDMHNCPNFGSVAVRQWLRENRATYQILPDPD
ncbi:MAG: hypothetical protein IPK21_21245 [Haliscomenobacter sp.]|nr:hypothetical protein [Haliscomenobacter sp.]